MGMQRKSATGPRGRRGARRAAGKRGKIGKAAPKGPGCLNVSHSKDVPDQFVTPFDDVYRQLTGLMNLIGKMQQQINELADKSDVVSPRA
jgi:hypothetical protein